MREFLHVDDLAEACVFTLENWNCSEQTQYLNVGTGIDLTIRELAELIAKTIGFDGDILWDTSKPDGTPKKQLDVSKINRLGWSSKTTLPDGIAQAINDFHLNHSLLRL